MDFFNHIGCRTGTFSGELKNKQKGQVPAIYVTASTRNNFEALLRSYNAYMAANRNSEMKWNNNNIQLIPMPTSQPNRTATLEAIKDIDQFFSACVRIKLKPINPEATDGDWKQLRQLREFVAVFPEYSNEDPDAQYYTLYLRKTPDTHMLTTNTIRQFTDFPTNILLPTLAAVTASPQTQPTNNQDSTTPTSSSHTNRLVAFTNRLLRRKHNNLDDTPADETPATTEDNGPETPNRHNHSSNQPNKRSAAAMQPTEDDDKDPYDDGTDWTTVAAKAHHFQNQNNEVDDRKPAAKRNQFAPLAEQQDDQTANDDMMDTEESDDHSRALIGSDDNGDNHAQDDHEFSATTMQEIELIFKYVAANNPSRIDEMREFLEHTKSFTNDTDAQDAWRFAQSLVQTGNTNIADSRTGHVVPHDKWAKGPNE